MTTTPSTPLVADEAEELEPAAVPRAASDRSETGGDHRDARFADGVRTLRVGGATIRLEERILLVLAGIVAPLGLVLILLGYLGAANTPFVFEQNSYLISGGLFGLALVFLGSFFYFAHWITQLVKEHRVQSTAVLEALQRLQDEVARERAAVPTVTANGHVRPVAVPEEARVATAKGTMAHRPGCAAVAGKTGLRTVAPGDGLPACKLCDGP